MPVLLVLAEGDDYGATKMRLEAAARASWT